VRMRLIEGTVEEIVEYQRATGQIATTEALTVLDEKQVAEDGSERSEGGIDSSEETWTWLKHFVYGRAKNGVAAERIYTYLDRVSNELGTYWEIGESQNTSDGYSPYVMVRADAPKRFGAVAYAKPRIGGVTVRLRPEDCADMADRYIQVRDVVETQAYAINCSLQDDAAVDVAVELTRRALKKVSD
jgi:hypothetical protein